ncbi:MAG: sodium:solute symporter family protein [Desulfurococcales archaeon]|nr:sodium:solute symporter family protein [Desulfurococcales archaeon]
MANPTIVTAIVFIYVLGMLAIGYIAWKRFRGTIEDFYLASRTVGGLVLFLTLAATYHSAFAFLTSVAVFSSSGVSFWIASMAWTTLAAVGGYVLGKRFFLLGKARGFITPADLLADFYNSEAIRVVTALLQALFVIGYIVVQAIGLGIILSIASGGAISYELASLIFVAITAFYLVLGGNRAAFWTDALQGVLMYVGIWIVGFFVLFKFFGGPTGLFDSVREVNPDLLKLNWGPGLFTSFILAFSFGIILLPHLWLRYYSAIDVRAIKIGSVGMALYISSYYIPAMIVGLAAAVFNVTGLSLGGEKVLEPGFIKSLSDAYGSRDAVMAYMIYTLTPSILAGILLAGAASAAMSTLDSLLAATAMVLTRDVYQRYISPRANESQLVIVSRLLVAAWAVIGYILAITKPGLIFDIVAIAASGGLQFLVPAAQAVFPRKVYVTGTGALAGIIVGTIVTILLTNRFPFAEALGLPALHPAQAGVIGLVFNAIVAVIVSRLMPKPVKSEEYSKIVG